MLRILEIVRGIALNRNANHYDCLIAQYLLSVAFSWSIHLDLVNYKFHAIVHFKACFLHVCSADQAVDISSMCWPAAPRASVLIVYETPPFKLSSFGTKFLDQVPESW